MKLKAGLLSFFLGAMSFLSQATESVVTLAGGKPVKLEGDRPAIQSNLPSFQFADLTFQPKQLEMYAGKTIVLGLVSSLDTGIGTLQLKELDALAQKVDGDVAVIAITSDLPFAIKRVLKEERIENIDVYSDALWHEAGHAFGVEIQYLGLMVSSLAVIDKEQKVAYLDVTQDLSKLPSIKGVEQFLGVQE